jgi:hypothetical protein
MAGALGIALLGPRLRGPPVRCAVPQRRGPSARNRRRHRRALRVYRSPAGSCSPSATLAAVACWPSPDARDREQPVDGECSLEMDGERVERRLDAGPRRRLRSRRAEARRGFPREAASLGEEAVEVGPGHPAVRRARAVRPAAETTNGRAHPALRPADVDLVARDRTPGDRVVPDVTGTVTLSPVITVSTASSPSPATAPGGPSMPSGSAIERPSIW